MRRHKKSLKIHCHSGVHPVESPVASQWICTIFSLGISLSKRESAGNASNFGFKPHFLGLCIQPPKPYCNALESRLRPVKCVFGKQSSRLFDLIGFSPRQFAIVACLSSFTRRTFLLGYFHGIGVKQVAHRRLFQRPLTVYPVQLRSVRSRKRFLLGFLSFFWR